MRVGEVTSSFPDIFLVLIIVATVKPRVITWVRGFEETSGIDWIVRLGVVDYMVISFALAIFSWFGMARLVRGQVLQVRENQYTEAARAIGASTPRILRVHVLPNVISPVIVFGFSRVGWLCGSGDNPQLVGNWHPTSHAQPRGDDLRERQHLRTSQRPSFAAVPRGHAGGVALCFQLAGRRGQRRLQSSRPLRPPHLRFASGRPEASQDLRLPTYATWR